MEGSLTPAIVAPKGIARKLQKLLGEVATVPKNGTNRAQNYKFVRETDLVDKIRPIMAEIGLFLNLSIVDHEIAASWKTSSGSEMRLTVVTIEGTWIDAETGEIWPLPSRFMGYGADTGDKGIFKAITGAEKYFLFKSFLVGTGDDPEGDEKTDRGGGSGDGPVRVRRGTPSSAVQRGGRAAGASGPQLNAITAKVREIGLTREALVALVGKTTGLEIPEDAKLTGAGGWFAQQSGGVVGKIIGALTELESEGGSPGPAERDRSHSLDEGGGDEGDGAGIGAADEGDDLPL